MTGYTVHTGSNDKFAAGWDQIFSAGTKSKKKGKKGVADAKAEKPAKHKAGKSASKKDKRGKSR